MFTQSVTTVTTVTTTVINVQAYQQMGINVAAPAHNYMTPQQLQIMNRLNTAPAAQKANSS